MPFALLALAMINVAVGTQGFAFTGVLAEIAKDLGISIGQAGFIVGASSITFAIGAPLAAALVAHVERGRIILASLVALTAINALCGIAESYPALLALRVREATPAAGWEKGHVESQVGVVREPLRPLVSVPSCNGRRYDQCG